MFEYYYEELLVQRIYAKYYYGVFYEKNSRRVDGVILRIAQGTKSGWTKCFSPHHSFCAMGKCKL
jgi:hypothetical protein